MLISESTRVLLFPLNVLYILLVETRLWKQTITYRSETVGFFSENKNLCWFLSPHVSFFFLWMCHIFCWLKLGCGNKQYLFQAHSLPCGSPVKFVMSVRLSIRL